MNSIKTLMIIVLALFQSMVNAQVLRPKTICKLPNEISESSGLVVLNDSIFITHNDSGNLPQLVQFKSDGIFTLQIFLKYKSYYLATSDHELKRNTATIDNVCGPKRLQMINS